MATVMKALDFVDKVKDIAENYKTLYIMGCFGAPMTTKNKTRYCKNHDYNKQLKRTAMIKAATSDTFGFDCVGLIKGVLWGWDADDSKTYGGASYKANGVPDKSANGMINVCTGVSTDFSNIELGEVVWCDGHIGVYIGNGLAVECTPAWKNKVQITAVRNIETKKGYNARTWTKHGKLPYIDYTDVGEQKTNVEEVKAPSKTKVDPAKLYNRNLAGSYKVTPSVGLHIRAGATTKKKSLGVLKRNAVVKNYGYYSKGTDGTPWYYVKTTDGVIGFCHSKYLKKC